MSGFEKWLADNDTGAALVKMALMDCPHDKREMVRAALQVTFSCGEESGAREMGKKMLRSFGREKSSV